MLDSKQISRRQFLRRAGGVTALFILNGCGMGQGPTPTTPIPARPIITPTPRGVPTTGVVSDAATATPSSATVTSPTVATSTDSAPADLATSNQITPALLAHIRTTAHPLSRPGDLDPLLERIGDAHYVLLGEASHGTAEYYTWRTEITKRLVREKGFSFVGVEGEWVDSYRVNAYVKGWPSSGTSARQVLNRYDAWPTWMWANEEVAQLVEWLREHNDAVQDRSKVGFYGLDLYGAVDAANELLQYLGRRDPQAAGRARRVRECVESHEEDQSEFLDPTGRAPKDCRKHREALLTALAAKATQYRRENPEACFNAEQNALVARNADRFYTELDSWNIRDTHMADTLDRLMHHHGPGAKAVVWEHNTHVGDARATNMVAEGLINLGQLARERHGVQDVVLVGFGSHRGTVIAAPMWGGQSERMVLPPAQKGSYEDAFHRAGRENKLIIFSDAVDPGPLLEPRGHRAIGVEYSHEYSQDGAYVPTILPKRYDAFLYLDETHALHPLHQER